MITNKFPFNALWHARTYPARRDKTAPTQSSFMATSSVTSTIIPEGKSSKFPSEIATGEIAMVGLRGTESKDIYSYLWIHAHDVPISLLLQEMTSQYCRIYTAM